MRKRLVALTLAMLIAMALTGCGSQNRQTAQEKIPITLIYSRGLANVEALVEEQLPDIDLQCERSVSAPMSSDIRRRLEAGYGPDLVISTQPVEAESISYVLPLDGYDFSARYGSSVLKNLLSEERLYYLPLPGQYNCFVVNKTLLDEAGIPLPENNDELFKAMDALRDRGIGLTDTGHAFAIREFDNVTVGNFVAGLMTPDFLGTTQGVRWLAEYEDKRAEMSGNWESAFSFLERLLEEDLINTMPFSRQGNAANNAIYMGQGKLVAAYGSSAFLRECQENNAKEVEAGTAPEYEYVMVPFFSETGAPSWVLTLPADYIGVNAELGREGNEEKLDACLRVLDLLSTQEGQEALMEDILLDNSYLKGFDAKDWKVPEGLEEVVEGGFVYYAKFPGRVIEYLGSQTSLFLGGKKSVEDCLHAVDDYYYNGSEEVEGDLSLVGSVAQDLIYENYNVRQEETALGNLVADSVASYSGAQIALVNGGGIRASLYEGDIMGEDLKAVCPFDNQIVVVEMEGKVLWETLENSLSTLNIDRGIPTGRFLQVSGIRCAYDGEQPAGSRVVSVSLADGTPVEDSGKYTVAITNYMAGSNGYLEGNGDGYTMLNLYSGELPLAEGVRMVKENVGTYREALRDYFKKSEDVPIAAAVEGRIVNVGGKQEAANG